MLAGVAMEGVAMPHGRIENQRCPSREVVHPDLSKRARRVCAGLRFFMENIIFRRVAV